MAEQKDLRALYKQNIAPLNAEIRQISADARKKALRLGGILLVLCLIGAIVLINMLDDSGLPDGLFYALAAALPLIAALVQYFSLLSLRDKLFKDKVVPQIAKLIDPELEYEPENFIDERFYDNSRLFRSAERYNGEDLFSGTYKGIQTAFSELHTEYSTTTTDKDGNEHTQWHEIFKGIFFAADFNKDFHGITQVVPDNAERLLGRTLGKLIQQLDGSRPGSLIRMENVDFEKRFAVYSTDAVEARYLLTPNLMERIMALSDRFRQGRISLAFASSNLYIGIPMTQNLFEYRSGDITLQDVERIYDDIMAFVSIIDELNLTLRIWTKE